VKNSFLRFLILFSTPPKNQSKDTAFSKIKIAEIFLFFQMRKFSVYFDQMEKISFISCEELIFKIFGTIFMSVRSTNQKIQLFKNKNIKKIFSFIFFK
jgi:hypothetical protein